MRRKSDSPISQAFEAAQGINLEALQRFALPVLRSALGLAKGLEKRAKAGGYDQVRQVIEEAITAVKTKSTGRP